MISLPGLLERCSRLNGTCLATRYGERSHTWSQLRQRVACLAGGLGTLPLSPADPIAILSLNSDRYYESIFAIPWAGFTMVPLNTRWALAENSYALADSGSRVLLFDDTFAEQAEALLAEVAKLDVAVYMGDGEAPDWALSYEDLIARSDPGEMSARSGDDMAGIFYTGGTTGFPKGVMQSHRAIWASAIGALPAFGMTRDSTYLHAAPMFHMADFVGSMNSILTGAAGVIVPGFEPGKVLQTIEAQGVTHALLVPAMIKMLLHHPDASQYSLPRMEYILYGASPMPAAVLEQCMALWPHINFAQAYGQTELAPIVTTLSADDHRSGGEKLKSAGRPTPVSDVRIVDENGNDCPPGSSGEIVVRGPHTMLGYWDKPEQTASALRNGWVYTGDAGRFDEDGYLYIVDRVKDMVVSGGENVFTTEVENAVISHAAVQDVAVIGIPDEEWGEAVHAIVILEQGCEVSAAEIIEHCRPLIAGYKLPKSVGFRDQPMPLSGAGKVLKTELRKPFWEGRERQVN